MAEGTNAPLVMIRRGRTKFIHSPTDPDLLFDLQTDPDELDNLVEVPRCQALVASLREEISAVLHVRNENLQGQTLPYKLHRNQGAAVQFPAGMFEEEHP